MLKITSVVQGLGEAEAAVVVATITVDIGCTRMPASFCNHVQKLQVLFQIPIGCLTWMTGLIVWVFTGLALDWSSPVCVCVCV